MNTLAEYHTLLSTVLTGQTISAVAWHSPEAPTFVLQNNDTVFIHVYVSTSDYDLAVSMRHNKKRHLAYILYDDKFASKEIEERTGTVVTNRSGVSTCVGTTIQEVAMAGSGQSVVLSLRLSNGQQLQYSTSFSNTACSVQLIDA